MLIAFVLPFFDFVKRYRYDALLLLALIGCYRISDVVMGVMANPFYHDMGFTKDEIATISKVYGVIMTLAGAAIGGVMTLRVGVIRTLFLGALLSAATNLLFAWLATRGHDLSALVVTISADNLSAGIASAAFIAYLSGITNVHYSATQYALFSSVMLLLPKFIAGGSGVFVEQYGYETFFTATALLGVPVLLLVWLARDISMYDRSKIVKPADSTLSTVVAVVSEHASVVRRQQAQFVEASVASDLQPDAPLRNSKLRSYPVSLPT